MATPSGIKHINYLKDSSGNIAGHILHFDHDEGFVTFDHDEGKVLIKGTEFRPEFGGFGHELQKGVIKDGLKTKGEGGGLQSNQVARAEALLVSSKECGPSVFNQAEAEGIKHKQWLKFDHDEGIIAFDHDEGRIMILDSAIVQSEAHQDKLLREHKFRKTRKDAAGVEFDHDEGIVVSFDHDEGKIAFDHDEGLTAGGKEIAFDHDEGLTPDLTFFDHDEGKTASKKGAPAKGEVAFDHDEGRFEGIIAFDHNEGIVAFDHDEGKVAFDHDEGRTTGVIAFDHDEGKTASEGKLAAVSEGKRVSKGKTASEGKPVSKGNLSGFDHDEGYTAAGYVGFAGQQFMTHLVDGLLHNQGAPGFCKPHELGSRGNREKR